MTRNNDEENYQVYLRILTNIYYERNSIERYLNNKFDHQFISKLLNIARRNKLSRCIINYACQENLLKEFKPCIRLSKMVRTWFDQLDRVIQLIQEIDIDDYMIIKFPSDPWKIDVSDIDLCLCDPVDLIKLSKKLVEKGYELFGSRLLAHPLKIMALPTKGFNENNNLSIDLYYGIRWIAVRVHSCPIIFSRKREKNYHGLHLNVPSLEDDLYIRATHAFYHAEIPLADVLQGIDLIQSEGDKLDIEYLVKISKKFGMLLPLLIYAHSMYSISNILRFKNTPVLQELILALLKELENKAIYKHLKILSEVKKDILDYPNKIPFLYMLVATVDNIKSAKYYNFLNKYHAIQTPLLIKMAQIVKR